MNFKAEKSCNGKKRYDNFTAAEKGMKLMLRYQDKGDGGFMHAYYCRHCDGYHFGHAPRLPGRKKT